MINLNWNQCTGNTGSIWCPLLTVNLAHAHFDGIEGVYVIWHTGNPSQVVRVGQGNIRERLESHRQDPEILAYQKYGNGLCVTWAQVAAPQHDGVESFLGARLSPLVGDRFPDVTPIEVNLPW
jgi:hypothetical protein